MFIHNMLGTERWLRYKSNSIFILILLLYIAPISATLYATPSLALYGITLFILLVFFQKVISSITKANEKIAVPGSIYSNTNPCDLRELVEKIQRSLFLVPHSSISQCSIIIDDRYSIFPCMAGCRLRIVGGGKCSIFLHPEYIKESSFCDIAGAIGHELGHFSNNDYLRRLLFKALWRSFVWFGFALAYLTMCDLAIAFITDSYNQISYLFSYTVPTTLVCIGVLTALINLFQASLLRNEELAADAFSAEVGGAELLRGALLSLRLKTTEPTHDALSYLTRSYPPDSKRMQLLKNFVYR